MTFLKNDNSTLKNGKNTQKIKTLNKDEIRQIEIKEYGYYIGCSLGKLIVFNNRKEKYKLDLEEINSISLYDFGYISSHTLVNLCRYNIPLFIYSKAPNLNGLLIPLNYTPNPKIRIAQYEAYINKEKRLKIAKNLLKEKLLLLDDLSYSFGIKLNVEKVIEEIDKIESIDKLHILLTLEKSQVLRFWNGIMKTYIPDWLKQERRIGRNSSLPFDNILNLLFSSLQNIVDFGIIYTNLDRFIGFIHTIAPNVKPSLTLDLLDIYRPLVYYFLINYIKEGKIKKEHFNLIFINRKPRKFIKYPLSSMLINDFNEFLKSRIEINGKERKIKTLILNDISKFAYSLLYDKEFNSIFNKTSIFITLSAPINTA